jgi:hypothetical protein
MAFGPYRKRRSFRMQFIDLDSVSHPTYSMPMPMARLIEQCGCESQRTRKALRDGMRALQAPWGHRIGVSKRPELPNGHQLHNGAEWSIRQDYNSAVSTNSRSLWDRRASNEPELLKPASPSRSTRPAALDGAARALMIRKYEILLGCGVTGRLATPCEGSTTDTRCLEIVSLCTSSHKHPGFVWFWHGECHLDNDSLSGMRPDKASKELATASSCNAQSQANLLESS